MRNGFLRRIGFASLLAFLSFATAAAFANDYYVSSVGNDSNDGSQTRPWKTIPKAIGSASIGSDGTTIHVGAGTYSSGITINRGGSSPSARLVLQCDPGVPSATVAIGKCMIRGATFGIAIESNNVDVIGFDIGGNANMNVGLLSVCNQTAAVACPTGNSNHFIGNYVHDLAQNVAGDGIGGNGTVLGCPTNGAIQVGSNSHGHTTSDPQAIRNFVLNFGINPSPSGCNTAQGIYFGSTPAGSHAIVQNNLIIKTSVSGITNADNLCDEIITNNTIISTKAGIILSGDGSNCPGGVPGHNTIANNAIFNSTNEQVFNVSGVPDCSSGAPTLWSHNISDGLKPDFSPARSSCDIITPTPWVHQSAATFFVNYKADGTGDYHLVTDTTPGDSTCVSGGTSPCVPSADFDGILRLSTISIGAYDVSRSASLPDAPTNLTAQVQ